MTVDQRWQYLRMMHEQRDRTIRKERGELLDEIVPVAGLNRAYARHLINKAHSPAVRHWKVLVDEETGPGLVKPQESVPMNGNAPHHLPTTL